VAVPRAVWDRSRDPQAILRIRGTPPRGIAHRRFFEAYSVTVRVMAFGTSTHLSARVAVVAAAHCCRASSVAVIIGSRASSPADSIFLCNSRPISPLVIFIARCPRPTQTPSQRRNRIDGLIPSNWRRVDNRGVWP